jgi:hypothetical protein
MNPRFDGRLLLQAEDKLHEEISKNSELTQTIDQLTVENNQLMQLNEKLMDEAESYRILLEDQTVSGEFLQSTLIRKASHSALKSLRRSQSRIQIPFQMKTLESELNEMNLKAGSGDSQVYQHKIHGIRPFAVTFTYLFSSPRGRSTGFDSLYSAHYHPFDVG